MWFLALHGEGLCSPGVTQPGGFEGQTRARLDLNHSEHLGGLTLVRPWNIFVIRQTTACSRHADSGERPASGFIRSAHSSA